MTDEELIALADKTECPDCCGNGQTIGPNSGEDIICPSCQGKGWLQVAERGK